ncbi:MAG: hypothetical protein IAE79_29130 [Anaerolinea sp.]|nr:hypothetical protein [Anaerolinea sp.]
MLHKFRVEIEDLAQRLAAELDPLGLAEQAEHILEQLAVHAASTELFQRTLAEGLAYAVEGKPVPARMFVKCAAEDCPRADGWFAATEANRCHVCGKVICPYCDYAREGKPICFVCDQAGSRKTSKTSATRS